MLAGMRHATTATVIAAVLLLAGCSTAEAPAASPSPEAAATPTPTPTGASTILEVWAVIGCEENDPLGTRGMLEEGFAGKTPPIVMQGSCRPTAGDGTGYFWQFGSPDDALTFLESGQLETIPTDAVFVDGAVVALTTDAATAQLLGSTMEPYPA